jgi:hypothetical protein
LSSKDDGDSGRIPNRNIINDINEESSYFHISNKPFDIHYFISIKSLSGRLKSISIISILET